MTATTNAMLAAETMTGADDVRVPALLAFINEQRGGGNQGPYAGAETEEALLAELMAQRSRDFWLEGKRQLQDGPRSLRSR